MQNENVFGGRVVLIYLINPHDSVAGGIPVLDPVVEKKHGREFLVGQVPSDPNDWSAGLTVGIAMDQIAHYLVFSTEEEFTKKAEFAGMSSSSMH